MSKMLASTNMCIRSGFTIDSLMVLHNDGGALSGEFFYLLGFSPFSSVGSLFGNSMDRLTTLQSCGRWNGIRIRYIEIHTYIVHLIINKIMHWDSSVYYIIIFISTLIFVSGKQVDVLKIKFLSVFEL